jgi:hypothetical protein
MPCLTIRWGLGIGKCPEFSTNAHFRHYREKSEKKRKGSDAV